MKNTLFNLFTAIKIVFSNKSYIVGFLVITITLFWLFLYIPVRLIPSNDFAFQLSILRPNDIFLLILLSLLTALSLTLHFYLLRKKVSNKGITLTIGSSFAGSTVGIFGSLFATASCAACVATILGFLGAGTVFFLLDHRKLIIVFSIMFMLISLYFTAQKVLGICEACSVENKSHKKRLSHNINL